MKITPLSQRDSKWASLLLGFNTNSKYNIGDYGCLITCLAMVYNYYTGKSITPSDMNEKLKALGAGYGFSVGTGYYVWGAFPYVCTTVKESYKTTPSALTDTQMNAINSAVDAGYPVMLEIDFDPTDADVDMHWVLATKRNKDNENDITINDPWTGTERSLKEYLGTAKKTARSLIEAYVTYTGDILSDPTEDSTESNVEASDDTVESLNEQIVDLKQQLSDMRDSRNKWKAYAGTTKDTLKSIVEAAEVALNKEE